MDLIQLNKILEKEPSYRIKQVKLALYDGLIKNWNEVKTLPLSLRDTLNKECPLSIDAQVLASKDKNTIKALITLKDDLKIETVLMKHKDGRNTVCVSSQVGCPLNCAFCATGKLGFERNLGTFEIVEQVLFFSRHLKGKGRVSNVVFMGMGEPFLNYDNVIESIKILNDKDSLNIGARHISISTAGVIEGINRLSEEKLQINLSVSLHAPNNDLRSELMPINDKHSIEELLESVDDYINKTNRKVMFEYLMLKDVNDSNIQAQELARLMRSPLYFLNLIEYNPTGVFEPSIRMKEFKELLEKRGVQVTQRYRFGQNIQAACGQLVSRA